MQLKITNESKDKINELINNLSLDEKTALIHGNSPFTVAGIPRLGIPELTMSDGPNGVKYDFLNNWKPADPTRDVSTYLPVGMNLSSSWNTELAIAYGEVLGREASARKKDILLGPSLNIIRTPLCGRNFEYFSEDPLLVGKIASAYIIGLQSVGVIACAKHYAANNQEYERDTVNVEMSNRALHEIYLPGFKASVEDGGVLSLMSAYNKFRGEYCSENGFLINDILKKEFGFSGCIISDWGAVHDTEKAYNGGLDIEMGTEITLGVNTCSYSDFYFANPLKKLIQEGKLDDDELNKKVRRVLHLHFWLKENKSGNHQINSKENQEIALNVALESIVLLKNKDKILPLQPEVNERKILVVGENAKRKHGEGGGAAGIMPLYEITPLEGLQNHAAFKDCKISFLKGYSSDASENNEVLKKQAVEAAKEADVVVFFGGFNHGDISNDATREFDTEFKDKKDIILPHKQSELIEDIAKVNPSIVTIFFGGSAFEMPFIDHVKAILQVWYPGMEGGNAIAKILAGDVSPSGRLPVTFPVRLKDIAAHTFGEYPGKEGTVSYLEDIFVGYRHFVSREIEPLFPFGHGLTYSEFTYQNMEVKTSQNSNIEIVISLEVENSGNCQAGEVVQIYMEHLSPLVVRPKKELKAFQKIFLNPGEKRKLNFHLSQKDFSYYSEELKQWTFTPGDYILHAGKSCNDNLLNTKIYLE